MTPLYYAAEKGQTAIATFLLERGADVHANDNVMLINIYIYIYIYIH